ncbi:TPA: hypothetical protein IVZ04_001539 [Enterococcus faecium]|uniref:hypothetical protein n=1 Tax=Enterococcus TaxID=1350 RepID=UPI0003641A28|nr:MULTISPECIES: hypothetical protein [Enterococcus]MDV4901571.1 hypothetical protein [Enterococcus faecium]MUP20928.1 hypothetical protein [Enterococcus lactis]NTP64167.1 hypothetical protein [Enterococcus faecium]WPL32209.1 hypothetical protein QE259_06100 [Enterococcus lactis]HAP8062247.1 hypothetical protein [Enterococcus faecium]
MNVSEERKITAGTISGATLKSIDIEPSIIIEGKSYTASEFNKAVEMLKQPQLNDNQKIVLEWLKSETILTREAPILSVNAFSDKNLLGKLPDKVRKAYKLLACKQEYEVLSAFAQWGLEQEEAE